MNYKIIKNFLDSQLFNKIKFLVMDTEFPWRKRDGMTPHKNDKMYFNHCFYNNMKETAGAYEPIIIPILNELNAVAPVQVRANMFISELFEKCDWHRDYNFNCKSAILYLNDCDGGTELKINNKINFIKAEENKIVVFDAPVLHRAITSKKVPIRYIVNFNYFTADKL
jgi:hypothetical protein|tara:strand:+ start:60 stop:563 length:504 start_codon:yes stop_codon:yes gene_type:complete